MIYDFLIFDLTEAWNSTIDVILMQWNVNFMGNIDIFPRVLDLLSRSRGKNLKIMVEDGK